MKTVPSRYFQPNYKFRQVYYDAECWQLCCEAVKGRRTLSNYPGGDTGGEEGGKCLEGFTEGVSQDLNNGLIR